MVLLIRQALGRGVLVQTESQQSKVKNAFIGHIESMLSTLLPIKQNIRPKLQRIIDNAVDLANTMTRERALFLCRVIPTGRAIEDMYMEVSDEDQKGKVFMCTFPMFCRRIMDEGTGRNVCLVKADVELESAFQSS